MAWPSTSICKAVENKFALIVREGDESIRETRGTGHNRRARRARFTLQFPTPRGRVAPQRAVGEVHSFLTPRESLSFGLGSWDTPQASIGAAQYDWSHAVLWAGPGSVTSRSVTSRPA